jgi:hypothetical protein
MLNMRRFKIIEKYIERKLIAEKDGMRIYTEEEKTKEFILALVHCSFQDSQNGYAFVNLTEDELMVECFDTPSKALDWLDTHTDWEWEVIEK